jgi:hypothetical protein
MLLAGWGCSGSDAEGERELPIGTVRDIRLSSHKNSVLSIGRDPVLEFPYDARGPGSPGTITYLGNGRARLVFLAEDMEVTHLEIVPGLPIGVEIIPTDQIGFIDFCTGEVRFSFDSLFRPYFFNVRQEPMSVVTEQTTGTSSGLFRQVTGRPMDAKGDLRMVSVAMVPKTGDPVVDDTLGLPTDAVSELEMHLHFPQERFPCPGAPPPGVAREVHMAVGKEGLLSIAFLGSFAEYPYDGDGSNGIATLGPVVSGRANVEFAGFEIPPMQVIPGSDEIRIEITAHKLSGSIDFCTGRMELDFDATFTPFVGKDEMTSLSIVTTITTETSTGYSRSITGERLDRWGNAHLVGVAKVPVTDDFLINLLLGLPNDAVCQLPVHLDFLGGVRPPCPGSRKTLKKP